MSKFPFENSDSKSSQSNFSENMISLSPKSQDRFPESQKPLSINETPLSTKGNVKSYCRIRPNNTYNSSLNKFKIENNSKTLIVDYTTESDRNNPSKQSIIKYNFTEVYWPHTSNKVIYEKVCQQNIDELFSRHRSSLIFVYGITNSGKTYTVNGNEEFPGILQLSLIELFNKYKDLKENNNMWQLTCTYIEIYNEEAYDLLSNDRKKLKIREATNRFYPAGNIVKTIEKISDFTNCLEVGEANKTKAETNANANSSRSHSIFRVELSYKDIQLIDPVSFCIVDLAGAERVSKSGVSGNGVIETGNINSSLLVLKNCFRVMEKNSKINNIENKITVPVRESKLTMLFKEYFAPHQNISVICTINPDKNDMMDIKSVLHFGAKAMRVKPMKSWIPIKYSNSKEVSPNKSRNKGNNSFIKDKKRYRMYTDKKYLNYNPKNNFSKEKINKNREDYYSTDHSNTKKKNNNISLDKAQNIKITKNKKLENNHIIANNIKHIDLNDENSNNNCQIYSSSNDENSNIHLARNGEPSNNNNSLNLFKIVSNSNYEQRIKCSTNPFELVIDNRNFFVQNGPSKEKLKLEQEMKEKKQKEMSKKGDEIKKMLMDLLIKKKYYNNFERNIEIYENQCNNIDLTEAEILLSKNSNIFSLKNPFIKNYKEDKHILSKSHQINLTYENVIKEKILKNENNINISYKGTKANNNLENFKSYNPDIPNNDFDIIRANKEFIEELQIKLNNSNNEIEQKMIQEFLDRSFQQYEKSQFKAHFGIGESLIKKIPEQQNKKEDNQIVQKFDIMNNDIEMADNLDNKNNDFNIDELFENTFNYKGKKGNNKTKEEISKNSNEMDDNKENRDDNVINKNNEDGSEDVSDIENKNKNKKRKTKKKKNDENDVKEKSRNKQKKSKKDKKSKKQKEKREEEEKEETTGEEREEKANEEREEKIDEEKNEGEKIDEDKDKEIEEQKENKTKKYPKSKSKKRNEKKYRKTNDDDTSEESNESAILAAKNNKKKKKKNKKRKIESDEDDIDGDNTFDEENANIKPIKSKKNKSKKLK